MGDSAREMWRRHAGVSRCGGVGLGVAAFLLAGALLSVAAGAQDQTALAAKLKAAGAPVRKAVLEGGSLVVSLEYAADKAAEPERIRSHALSVFRTAAGTLPAGATRVTVEIGVPGEVYDIWSAASRDAADFAGGKLDERRFMALLEMRSPLPLKEMIEAALPDEKEIERQLKMLEAESRKSAGGAAPAAAPKAAPSTQAGPMPAPAAKPAPDKPAPAKPDAAKPQSSGTPAATAPSGSAKPATPPPGPVVGAETPKALFERGEQLLKEGDYWGATEYFRRTLDAFPMEANQGLGLCYYGAGLVDAALRHFAEAYRLEPRSRLTVLYLGTCNDKLGRREEAVRRYEEYLALGPDDPKVAEFVRGRLAALR